jgi:hypothetical protein
MMPPSSKRLASLCSLTILSFLGNAGCSGRDAMRIDASGFVNIKGQPVPSGTLVLTPKVSGRMPVASRIVDGQFAFDTETGPRPGEYSARVNTDEATIEEISTAAAEDPRAAERQFNLSHSSSSINRAATKRETSVVIGEGPGQTIKIDL